MMIEYSMGTDRILEQKKDISRKKNSAIQIKSGVRLTVMYQYWLLSCDDYIIVP